MSFNKTYLNYIFRVNNCIYLAPKQRLNNAIGHLTQLPNPHGYSFKHKDLTLSSNVTKAERLNNSVDIFLYVLNIAHGVAMTIIRM